MKPDADRPRKLLFERAKTARHFGTDAELAAAMKVTPQTLSQWKSGQVALTDERVIQLAELAGDEPELWVMLMSFSNAKTAKARKVWGQAMLRVALDLDDMLKATAQVLVTVTLLTPLLLYASPATQGVSGEKDQVFSADQRLIMRSALMSVLCRFRRWLASNSPRYRGRDGSSFAWA